MKKDAYGGVRKDFSDMFEPKHDNGFEGEVKETVMGWICCFILMAILVGVYLMFN